MSAAHLFYPRLLLTFLLVSAATPAGAETPSVADTVTQGTDKKASRSLSGSFLSGYYALTQGDTAVARRSLEQVVKEDPNNLELRGRLLLMQIADGDMAQAIENAKELKTKDGHELIVDLLLAVDKTRDQKYPEALEAIKAANVPQFSETWLPLIRSWLEHPDGSAPKPTTMATLFPGRKNVPSFLTYHVGLINEFTGYHDEANKFYTAAIKDLNRAPFRAMQAYIQQRARDDDRKALTAFVNRLKQNRSDTLSLLIGRYPYLEHLDGPQALPMEYLVNNPKEGFAEVLFTMASLLYAIENKQDVVLYLRMAIYLRPDFPTAQIMLANIFEASGHTDQALEIYGQLLPESQLYIPANVRRAYLLDGAKRSDEALALLDKISKTAPASTEIMVARGDILRTQRKYQEAIVHYNEAIAKTPTPNASHWALFFARGTCYERIGDMANAEIDLKQALKLAPNQPEVLNYLGYMWLTNDEKKDKAFGLIERAYTLSPNEPHIIDSYGWANYLTGKLEKATKLLEEAASLDPNEPTINDHLGDIYFQSDRKTEAEYQWQRALDQTTDIEQQAVLKTKLKEGLKPYPFTKPKNDAPTVDDTPKELIYE